MANVFLKVDKGLFSMGLNPVEILILAQVTEFLTNTGDCFISDKQLAEQFGVSESTISRELKKLESGGYIVRETKNVKNGKERHIRLASGKMMVGNENNNSATVNLLVEQQSNCLLYNRQNDLIKDNNEKINLKDNLKNDFPEEGKIYPKITKTDLERYKCAYEPVAANIVKILSTGKIVEVVA